MINKKSFNIYLPLVFILGSSSLYGIEKPADAPETPGIQQQKIDEISKIIKTNKNHKAIIDKLKVSKEAKGAGENRIKGPSFILQNVSITGNTTFKQKKIIEIIKPFVGKSVDTIDLKYIAEKVTNLYKKNGYLTSKCIIPAQKVQNGKVKFQIIEDKLGRIVLKGKTTYNYDSNLFMKYLSDLQGKIINAEELNNRLKLLSSLPVTRVKPSLQKTKNGFTNLILDITEGQEKFSISVDNSGSKYSGKNRITFNGNINNIRGKSDSLNLSLTTVKNPKYLTSFSTSYVTPYGKNGGRLTFGYSYMYYQLNPDEVGTDLVIYEGKTNLFSLNYGQPLYWLDNANLSFNYGFEKKTINAKTIQNHNDAQGSGGGDVIVDGKDELFVLNSSISYGKADKFFSDKYIGVNTVTLTAKKAIEGFWNTMTQEDLDRKETDQTFPVSGPVKYGKYLNPAFLKYYYSLSRKQQLPYNITSTLSLNGNYTNDRVPDSYEYGGGDFGYGYSLGFSKKLGIVNSSISVSESKIFEHRINATEIAKDGSIRKLDSSPSMN